MAAGLCFEVLGVESCPESYSSFFWMSFRPVSRLRMARFTLSEDGSELGGGWLTIEEGGVCLRRGSVTDDAPGGSAALHAVSLSKFGFDAPKRLIVNPIIGRLRRAGYRRDALKKPGWPPEWTVCCDSDFGFGENVLLLLRCVWTSPAYWHSNNCSRTSSGQYWGDSCSLGSSRRTSPEHTPALSRCCYCPEHPEASLHTAYRSASSFHTFNGTLVSNVFSFCTTHLPGKSWLAPIVPLLRLVRLRVSNGSFGQPVGVELVQTSQLVEFSTSCVIERHVSVCSRARIIRVFVVVIITLIPKRQTIDNTNVTLLNQRTLQRFEIK